MFEIVAGVGDHEQFVGRQDEAQTESQFRAADPARQRHDKSFAHRNMSSAAGRTSSDAPLSGPRHVRPRTTTTGWPSAPCPITSEAAAAISSACPVMLTWSSRPNRSGEPRRSISDGRPAAPIATPQVPRRQARPKLSLMITATGTSNLSDRRLLNIAALPSGSAGSSSARWESSGEARLDWSMPALAITRPSRCSTIRTPGLVRTTRTDSDRISSTKRGSFWTLPASSIASVEGSTVARSTMRPSALDTIFCVSTKTSPPRGTMPPRATPSPIKATKSSSLRTSGMPGTANISTMLLRFIAGPAHSAETLAQPRQHVLAVEFQKARLIWSRRVEYQIPETETDIVTDPLYVLVGVAGHDPS